MRYSTSRNSNALEYANYERRSSDYAWQLSLASLAIIVSLPVIATHIMHLNGP